MNLNKKICNYVYHLKIDSIQERIVQLAIKAFIDTIGVTIYGSSAIQGKRIAKILKMKSIPREEKSGYTIIGMSHKIENLFEAIQINTINAYLNEYNDLFYGMPGHPSAILIPVILAVGEENNNSVKDIFESYITGIEVTSFINKTLFPKHHTKGFHSTSIAGIIGASMAAGKLLKQNEDILNNTLGIACSLASGLRRNFGTHANFIHVSNAASNGAKAAYLAQVGLESDKNLLSGGDGFLAVFNGNLEKAYGILSSLGKESAFDNPGLIIKKYPACFSTYGAIDSTLSILDEAQIDIKEIKKIDCLTSKMHYNSLNSVKATSLYSQHFCLHYCIAVALLEKKIDLDSFKEEKHNQPYIQSLMKCIYFGIHPELINQEGFGFTSVRITMKNGKTYEKRTAIDFRERVENWTFKKLHNKFKACTRSIIGECKSNSVFEFLKNIRDSYELKAINILKQVSIN